MTVVIDFGSVDWGKIWGDRASLVNADHLKELNSITNATHLSHPGYWRNLFSSYPEVISRQGFIARQYLIPGRESYTKTTTQNNEMTKPADMNSFVQKANVKKEIEHKEFLTKPEPNIFQKAAYTTGRETGVTKAIEDTGEAIEKAKSDVKNFFNKIGEDLDEAKRKAEQLGTALVIGAVVIGGAYVYGQVKSQ